MLKKLVLGVAGVGGGDQAPVFGAKINHMVEELYGREGVDLQTNELPLARPVATGGTGATDAAGARSNLGLGSVDNTSDALKPISTATQLALNEKVAKSDVIALTKGGTGATDAVGARTALGLGDAATKTVGSSNGNLPAISGLAGVLGNGYGGIAPVIPGGTDLQTYKYVTGWYGLGGTYTNAPVSTSMTSQMLVSLRTYGAGAAMIFQLWNNAGAEYYIGQSTWTAVGDGTYTPSAAITWRKVYTTANTTVDANGFIKSASPIAQIYADHIELNSEAKEQSITFEKLGIGNYLIKGSTGFAQEGWYVEQPKDANGNIYHVVIYDTLANGDITLKTYEKALNDVGDRVPDLANPVDIKVDRFIAIRLEPLPVEDTDVDATPDQP